MSLNINKKYRKKIWKSGVVAKMDMKTIDAYEVN